jgi:negative regulator of flagellin synthesis FlgM
MNTTISNNGLPLLPQTPGNQTNSQAPAGGTTVSSDATASTQRNDDRVRLTDSARALQDAAKVDGQPAIDSKRVEQIRQSIADGSYKINPAGIADKMMALEAQITGTTSKP